MTIGICIWIKRKARKKALVCSNETKLKLGVYSKDSLERYNFQAGS